MDTNHYEELLKEVKTLSLKFTIFLRFMEALFKNPEENYIELQF